MNRRFFQLIIAFFVVVGLTIAWVTQPILFSSNSNHSVQVDSVLLEKHVRMLSEDFVPRDFTHPENLNATAAYIRAEFEQTNGRVSEQPFEIDGVQYKNVILELGPPIDQSNSMIVLGAHYDAFDVHPAADDNASGVAGLLELGRLLFDGEKLNKTVQLVAYTLEEPPFFRSSGMGSAQHATVLSDANVPIELMISIEMIGYFSDEPDSQRYPIGAIEWLYPTTGNFVAVIGRFDQGLVVRNVKRAMLTGSNLPAHAIAAPTNVVPGIDFSDHLNYWKFDYPAVMISDTAFNRNFAYHTPDDTADRLDYDRMAEVVKGIYAVVIDLQ